MLRTVCRSIADIPECVHIISPPHVFQYVRNQHLQSVNRKQTISMLVCSILYIKMLIVHLCKHNAAYGTHWKTVSNTPGYIHIVSRTCSNTCNNSGATLWCMSRAMRNYVYIKCQHQKNVEIWISTTEQSYSFSCKAISQRMFWTITVITTRTKKRKSWTDYFHGGCPRLTLQNVDS